MPVGRPPVIMAEGTFSSTTGVVEELDLGADGLAVVVLTELVVTFEGELATGAAVVDAELEAPKEVERKGDGLTPVSLDEEVLLVKAVVAWFTGSTPSVGTSNESPDVDVVAEAPETPTQYASPAQKFFRQSLLTAGFSFMNSSTEIPSAFAMLVQVMPSFTRAHLLQFAGEPDMVGPGGFAVPAGVVAIVVLALDGVLVLTLDVVDDPRVVVTVWTVVPVELASSAFELEDADDAVEDNFVIVVAVDGPRGVVTEEIASSALELEEDADAGVIDNVNEDRNELLRLVVELVLEWLVVEDVVVLAYMSLLNLLLTTLEPFELSSVSWSVFSTFSL